MFNVTESNRWTPLKIIAAATVGVFLLQAFAGAFMGGDFVAQWGALDIDAIKHGQIWRLVTYAFIHTSFLGMFLNVLSIVLIGWSMEKEIGGKAMAVIYALMALAGGLAYTLVHSSAGIGMLTGASAAAIGILALFCFSYPDRPITLLLFFILPVTVKPKYILYFTLGFNAFGLLFSELNPATGLLEASVGYSAHLGGIVAAWAVNKYCLHTNSPATTKAMNIIPPAWVKNKTVVNKNVTPNYQVNLSSRAELQQEVDRILDKINTKGFGSLTNKEKTTLDKAKDILGK